MDDIIENVEVECPDCGRLVKATYDMCPHCGCLIWEGFDTAVRELDGGVTGIF